MTTVPTPAQIGAQVSAVLGILPGARAIGIKSRFVDPRLVQHHPRVARALLETEPEGGYPPAPSGFIQADLVWDVLFKALLGLSNGDRDAEAWIEWGLDSDKRQLASELASDMIASRGEAVDRIAGAGARTVFECAAGKHGNSTLAIGLVARVLFGSSARNDPTATDVVDRLATTAVCLRHLGNEHRQRLRGWKQPLAVLWQQCLDSIK